MDTPKTELEKLILRCEKHYNVGTREAIRMVRKEILNIAKDLQVD